MGKKKNDPEVSAKVIAIWQYLNDHPEGVTESMLLRDMHIHRSIAMPQLEKHGYLTWTDEKLRVYPYKKVDLTPIPPKSIPYYFMRWLVDTEASDEKTI